MIDLTLGGTLSRRVFFDKSRDLPLICLFAARKESATNSPISYNAIHSLGKKVPRSHNFWTSHSSERGRHYINRPLVEEHSQWGRELCMKEPPEEAAVGAPYSTT